MASGKRKDGESFKEYRLRLENEDFQTKQKLKAKLFWNSSKYGTYRK